ncbi:hypothetical protein [Gemmobacter nectariphilus]|uniref:hypothetical protein n=1 Tax=Gemmobacter nectariphilus TaxID=220343 RepID=UPI001FE07D33|nr:hypothetical protein [Gemmobacter nectariphilus]
MARWVRRPPSVRQVVLVVVVIALCLAIAGFEWLFGWPEALTPNSGGVPRIRP